MSRANAAFNHIALSVPDGEAAVKWYTDILGFRVVVPLATKKSTDPDGPLLNAIYGPELKEMKMAILSSGNDVGVEIFEFVDPPYNGPPQRVDWNPNTYTLGGAFHFCFTVPDVDSTAAKVVRAGGRIVGEFTEPTPGIRACYMQDPWGNTVELLNCTFNQLFLTNFSNVLERAQKE